MSHLDRKREEILRHCRERGIDVYQLRGEACRLIGAGVDLLIHDLATLRPSDLEPHGTRPAHALTRNQSTPPHLKGNPWQPKPSLN